MKPFNLFIFLELAQLTAGIAVSIYAESLIYLTDQISFLSLSLWMSKIYTCPVVWLYLMLSCLPRLGLASLWRFDGSVKRTPCHFSSKTITSREIFASVVALSAGHFICKFPPRVSPLPFLLFCLIKGSSVSYPFPLQSQRSLPLSLNKSA
jgi:hypothetical protein